MSILSDPACISEGLDKDERQITLVIQLFCTVHDSSLRREEPVVEKCFDFDIVALCAMN